MIFFAPGAGWRGRRYYFSRGRLKSLIELDSLRVFEGNIAPSGSTPSRSPDRAASASQGRRYDFFSRPGLAGTAL